MLLHVHIIVKLIYNLNLLFLQDKNMNKVNRPFQVSTLELTQIGSGLCVRSEKLVSRHFCALLKCSRRSLKQRWGVVEGGHIVNKSECKTKSKHSRKRHTGCIQRRPHNLIHVHARSQTWGINEGKEGTPKGGVLIPFVVIDVN